MRIATWNVERPSPRGWKKPPAQLRRMAEVDADVWVLTETHLQHQPTPDHRWSTFSPPHPERLPEPERWTGIWSRWPMTPLIDPAAHQRGTAAAKISTPRGDSIVYGTVIAWANEPLYDDGRPARMWEVHVAEIERQGKEWRRIRERHPNTPLIVAGDFNQDRDGSGWYGTRATRRKLTGALDLAGLTCVTAEDVVASGHLQAQHLVDHICMTTDLATSTSLSCFEATTADGQRLSDHPVVVVDIA